MLDEIESFSTRISRMASNFPERNSIRVNPRNSRKAPDPSCSFVFIGSKRLLAPAVQVALQQNRRRGFVHFAFSLAATYLRFGQQAMRLH